MKLSFLANRLNSSVNVLGSLFLSGFVVQLAAFGSSNGKAVESSKAKEFPSVAVESTKIFASDYASKALQTYTELLTANQALQLACNTFIQNPTSESLAAAQTAWKQARDVYSVSEVFRFYGGPIDDPKNGPEGLMNAWPIDESYLDGVKGKKKSGIVFNKKLFPIITAEKIESANEKGGEKNISTGYHAIEFLLWGQDFSTKSAGERKFSDFVGAENTPQGRRRALLKAQNELLVKHSQYLVDGWKDGAENYRKAFIAEEPQMQLKKILTGLTSLAADELAGERMMVPLERNDSEHEQNCFSDYTSQDFANNVAGLRLVFGSDSEVNLSKLFALLPSDKETLASQNIANSLKAIEVSVKSIPAPFDAVLATKKGSVERKSSMETIEKLGAFSKEIAKTASEFGIRLNVAD